MIASRMVSDCRRQEWTNKRENKKRTTKLEIKSKQILKQYGHESKEIKGMVTPLSRICHACFFVAVVLAMLSLHMKSEDRLRSLEIKRALFTRLYCLCR